MREREREREREERERETEETDVGERAHGTKVNPKGLQTRESRVQAVAADEEVWKGMSETQETARQKTKMSKKL